MADVSNIVVKITAKADGFKKGIRESLSLSKRFTRETKVGLDDVTDGLNDASRAAGITRDKMGKLREATGKFVSTERMAELGIENWNKAADKGGKKAKSFSFRIGRLKVDFTKLSIAARKARSGISKIGGALPSVKAGFTAAALSAAGFVAALTIKASQIKRISQLSETLDITTRSLQEWNFAAGKFGIDGDKVADIFKDISDKIGDFVATGGGEAKDIFEKLSLDAEKFRKMSPDEIILDIGRALDKSGVTNKEKIFFLEALANDASMLLPLLGKNEKKFKDLAKQAEETGNILTEQQVKSAAKFSTTIGTMIDKARGFWSQVTGFLSEPLDILSKKLDEIVDKFGGPTEAAKVFAKSLIDGVAGALKGLSFLIEGFKEFQLGLEKTLLSFDKFNQFNPFARAIFEGSGFDINQQIKDRESRISQLKSDIQSSKGRRSEIAELADELKSSIGKSVGRLSGESAFDKLIDSINQMVISGEGTPSASIERAQKMINDLTLSGQTSREDIKQMQGMLDQVLRSSAATTPKDLGKMEVKVVTDGNSIAGELQGSSEFLRMFRDMFDRATKQTARAVAQ